MALIKSALELALERTKDIQSDKQALNAKAFKEKGMKLAAQIDNGEDLDLAKVLGSYKNDELSWLKEGLSSVTNGLLSLPSNEAHIDRLNRLKPVFTALSKDKRSTEKLLDELSGFFRQYLEQKEQIIQAITAQAEPKLRQKEEALYQQTGQRVHLTIDTDPEISKYVKMNFDKLAEQYEQALEGIRGEFKRLGA